MKRRNIHHTRKNDGSALIVTMLIVAAAVIMAITLLDRMMTYSEEVNDISGATQAYYTAYSQMELGLQDLSLHSPRQNIDILNRITESNDGTLMLGDPDITTDDTGEYVVIASHTHLPLQIRLYANDSEPTAFGSSATDPRYYAFSSYEGGLLFDLTNTETMVPPFSLTIQTDEDNTNTKAKIGVEFIRLSKNGSGSPFYGTLTDTEGSPGFLDNQDIQYSLSADGEQKLEKFFQESNNCDTSTCSLRLLLRESEKTVIPVQFTASEPLPDLNAIVVADGLSAKGTFYHRIVKLVPQVQSI